MHLRSLSEKLSGIAIDLGTCSTRIALADGSIVLDEPSVIAVNQSTGTIEAVGQAARDMVGRTPESLAVIQPIQGSIIGDLPRVEAMLQQFLWRIWGHAVLRPRVIAAIPAEISDVQIRAITAVLHLAAREVFLVDQGLAAAIGAGLTVLDPAGSMIVDVGGGSTRVSVLSLGGIVDAHSVGIGGEAMDEAIVGYLRRKHNLLVGYGRAEALKCEIGTAHPPDRPIFAPITGRDAVSGMPATLVIGDAEIRRSIAECLNAILVPIRTTLELLPPEISSDLAERGMVLLGGGALLRGLDRRIRTETGVPVCIANEPFTCVVRGAATLLSQMPLLARMSAHAA